MRGFAFGLIMFFQGLTSDAQVGLTEYQLQAKRSVDWALANFLENGAIIASPSTASPNYYFEWIRDSALSMRGMLKVLDQKKFPFVSEATRKIIRAKVDLWVKQQLITQETEKPTGLGEPRFYVDGRANLDLWGRPQNDGPALRAITAIEVAQIWTREGRLTELSRLLYRPEFYANTLIKRDLEYVAHHWQEPSVDLWEEDKGMHFYTLVVQKAALEAGAKFVRQQRDPQAADFYETQAAEITRFLNRFYNSAGMITASIENTRSDLAKGGLDIAVLLAANHADFVNTGAIPQDRLIKTVNALSDYFLSEYGINKRVQSGQAMGVAMGRYPNDVYDGVGFSKASPWFLATLAVAEFDCRRAGRFTDAARLQLERVRFHVGEGGAMSEQFNRDTGFQQGARSLTWSHVAYITAYSACF